MRFSATGINIGLGGAGTSWQWQPSLTSHDPNPPITLENPPAAPQDFPGSLFSVQTEILEPSWVLWESEFQSTPVVEASPPPEELSILLAGYHEYQQLETEASDVYQIYDEASAPVDVEVIVTVYDPSIPEGTEVADSVHYIQIEDAPEQPAVLEIHLDDPEWGIPTEESVISIILDEAPSVPEEVTIIQSGYYDFRPEEGTESEVGYVFEDAPAPTETDVPESLVTSIEDEIGLLEAYLGLVIEDAETPDQGSVDAVVTEIAELLALDESFVPTDPIEDAPPELEVIYQIVTDEFEVRYDADPSELVYYFEEAPPITNVMRVWIGRGAVVGTGMRIFIKG